MKPLSHLFLTLALGLGVVGCSSVSLDESAPKGPAPIVQAGQPPAPALTAPAPAAEAVSPPPVARGLQALRPEELRAAGFGANGRASVYFEFDQSTIRREDQPLIEGTAALLKRPAGPTLVIEGNTDDRGPAEYNLALGQRRAETVKRALVILGVDEARIEAVSNGEEKPRRPGGQESDHAENRRADLVLR